MVVLNINIQLLKLKGTNQANISSYWFFVSSFSMSKFVTLFCDSCQTTLIKLYMDVYDCCLL